MRRFRLLLSLTVFCILSAGCSQVVTVSHKAEATHSVIDANSHSSQYLLPTKVLIQPPVIASEPKKKHMGLLIAGLQNRWVVDLNKTLPEAIQIAALKTYRNVEIGNSCLDCGLTFRSTVKQIDIEKLSMRVSVEIEVGIYDAYNTEIARIKANGKSPIMDAARLSTGVASYFIPFFGTAMGKSILAKTSRKALNEAIADFHNQIAEQTHSGVLARNWLPKRENRGYETGDHQFPAERTAIAAGCGTQGDEVRLIKQNYFAESFIANCWGKPSFAIDCEYGRCALREEHPSLAQQEYSY